MAAETGDVKCDKIVDESIKETTKNLNEDTAEDITEDIPEDASLEEPFVDRYKEFSYKWNDPESDTILAIFTTNELIVLLEGALVAGLGLFLMCSPSSGIITQAIGSLVFLSGIIIVTL